MGAYNYATREMLFRGLPTLELLAHELHHHIKSYQVKSIDVQRMEELARFVHREIDLTLLGMIYSDEQLSV